MIRKEDPTDLLLDVLGGGASAGDAIERQEALVNSTQLPVDGSEDPAVLALGIKFGDPVTGDDLFREATLPEGWSKHATAHSMYSEIVDETWAVRATVFYKAAFYDRSAFIRAKRA